MKPLRETKTLLRGGFIEEDCPCCKAQLVGNRVGEKWCSKCDYGIIDFTRHDSLVEIKQIRAA